MKCIHPLSYEKLGFDQILGWVERNLQSEEAKAHCQELKATANYDELYPELLRVQEFKNILEFGENFPAGCFVSIGNSLEKLSLAGNWLDRAELFQLLRWMRGIQAVQDYLKKGIEEYPELHALVFQHQFDKALLTQLDAVLDERGNIRDDASPELARIRKSQNKTASTLRNTLYKVLRNANEHNWSQEKEITIRNDRLVIPVKAEAKGRVPGFVQDISQSGATVFIEPAAALPLNNALRELQIQEQKEIVRILQEVSAHIAAEVPVLEVFRTIMVQVEFIRAKARLARSLNASLPRIHQKSGKIVLREAYYPLLQLKAQQEELEVVPLNMSLDEENRIILISGPNAGGKSVALKCLGLLQLMLQAGFLIPVSPDSEFILFKSLFIDIGDEQSVESDLSTYTSRLYQWRRMGDRMNRRSLFLIDEFGSGTDPKQGGAVAESFLERFITQKAYGIITTHYGNLKDFAEITAGINNAAMQFDTKALKPTYRLVEGMPGRSYAFEMARRVGVHHTIIRRARKKVGGDELETDQLLKELERKTAKLSKTLKENEKNEARLKKLLTETEARNDKLQRERKQILRDAKIEAKSIIEQANKKVENTIREIREKQADKKATKKIRASLEAAKPEIPPALKPLPKPELEPISKKKGKKEGRIRILENEQLAEGDWAKFISSDSYGRLIELKGNRAVLEVGEVRMTVKANQLVKIALPPKKLERKVDVKVLGGMRKMELKTEIDVMGMRVEKALTAVNKMVDNAHLAGLKRVRILHGKGTGVLREAIRKHLRDFDFVRKVGDAPVEDGGAGWTVCEFH